MTRIARCIAAFTTITGLMMTSLAGCGAFSAVIPDGATFAQPPGFAQAPGAPSAPGGTTAFAVAPGATSPFFIFFPGLFGGGANTGTTAGTDTGTSTQGGSAQQTTPNTPKNTATSEG